MNLRRGLMAQMARANGLRYAKGTIVIETQTGTPPTVTHNLGTKKIFAMWWLESGTHYSTYNRFAYHSFVNYWDIVPENYIQYFNNSETGQVWELKEKVNQTQLAIGNTSISPAGQQVNINDTSITENTLKLLGGYYNIWVPGVYHWFVVALDEALDEQ